MKCSNCRHWQYSHTIIKKLGTCEVACKRSAPYTADFIQSTNEIVTWENFGCVRFEDKRNFLERIFKQAQ